MKFLENIDQYIKYAIIGMLILTVLNTCNSCSSNRETARVRKEITTLTNKVDSLYEIVETVPKETATKEEINDIMEEKLWKFLELEELSDKNHIPINELKHKDKNNF